MSPSIASLIRIPGLTGKRPAWTTTLMALIALLSVLGSALLFVLFPLESLPYYFGNGWFVLDATSMLFVAVVNLVFLGTSVYLYSWIHHTHGSTEHMLSRTGLSLLFMVALNLGLMCNHLLLMWSLIEVTTLCITPLVTQGYGKAPQRVAWRYLLYSSMSLGLAFLGFMCLARSAQEAGLPINFSFDQMSHSLPAVMDTWQQLGLALIMLGLGCKLGLAPLYGWLPETYETAPTSSSALLAAAQFNVNVVLVFRILQVYRGRDLGIVSQELLVMGSLSLIVAAIQMMAAKSYKRLIAYACVSSSGVIAIGLSVGKVAAYGVVLYVVSNAFVKSMLFVTAGRLRSVYGTNDIAALSGVIKRMPFSGVVLSVGVFALLGFPPFGSFMAEMLILSGIVQYGNLLVFTVMCAMLTVIFVATGRSLFPMLWGPLPEDVPVFHEPWITATPKLVFVVILVLLGIYTPDPVSYWLTVVAQSIGGY